MNRPTDTRSILVTGSHRSGTTWVGRTLCYAPGTEYVHEPLNPESDRGLFDADLPGYFTYIGTHNEDMYRPAMDDVFALRYRVLSRIRRDPGLRSAAAAMVRAARFALARTRGRLPVVKDPIAFFSAPWICRTYNVNVVVLIRHPAAFAASLKAKGWTFDFSDLLSQSNLVEDYLGKFKYGIEFASERPGSTITQAVLLWRIIYSTVATYKERFPSWNYIRHEDLSMNPQAGFERLFESVGLTMDSDILDRIDRDTTVSSPSERTDLKRDSRANIHRWKTHLTPAEIDQVRQGTSDVWPLFYDDADW